MLCHEYGHVSPWVTVGGYGLATLVAADRLRLDRHYLHDVCAGAAIGIGATELTYYVKRKLLKDRPLDVSFTGSTVSLRLYL
jgi:membrane-associated phospholipid phosphatase